MLWKRTNLFYGFGLLKRVITFHFSYSKINLEQGKWSINVNLLSTESGFSGKTVNGEGDPEASLFTC